MRYTILFVLLNLLLVSGSYANRLTPGKDTSLIYSAVIKTISTKKEILVSDRTITKEIKAFDFKHVQNYLGLRSSVIERDPLWRIFLEIIDTANIHDFYKVGPIKDTGKKVKIFSRPQTHQVRKDPTYNKNAPKIVEFSPVIISPAGKKAIVFMQSFTNSDDISTTIFFLEYKNVYPYIDRDDEWVVVYEINLSVT